MTNIIPNSNLPASSQPWGREIQKRLQSLESEVARQKINNNSADSQIQASYKRLDETVRKVIGLEAPNSEYKIDARNITNGIYTIYSNGEWSGGTILDESTKREHGQIRGLTSPSIDPVTFQIVQKNQLVITTVPFGDDIIINAGNDTVIISDITLLSANAPTTPGGGIPIYGTTGASITQEGRIIRTPSSIKYKQDVEELNVNYQDLLSLIPKRFRLKNEVSQNENARHYAGFIAEDIMETSLTDFVAYATDEEGNKIPEGVYYGELTAALLSAIKHQDQLIKSLTSRVEKLENKDKV
jgi:hypothetical protein